ncbi:MAG: glycosyltransferase [Halobacteriales archaeon]|nr:glycosyltransferase [Halobacteriales archaeon]
MLAAATKLPPAKPPLPASSGPGLNETTLLTGGSPSTVDLIAILVVLGVLAVAFLVLSRPRRAARGSGVPGAIGATVGAMCGIATYTAGYVSILLNRGYDLPGALARAADGVTYWEIVLAMAGAMVGAVFARYRWRSLGLLSYVGLVTLVAGYLMYAVTTAIPQVPPDQRWLSLILLCAEAGSLTLVLIFAFYSLDVASRKTWLRMPERLPRSRRYVPKVAVHVPIYNEPYDVVSITIARLMAMDYPKDRFMVMVLDDSSDEAGRNQVQAFCRQVGARYLHRPDRRGFKAGALNYALRRTPRDVELIGVVDADYWVEPDYLRSVVGYFVNPRLGFLQTPQDYRNIEESYLTKQYYNAEAYFYHAVLPSRNEENAIIFCGTMGLIRRRALEQSGGWGEEHVCEDAELSVRLAALGWDSLYVGKSFGKGLMPAVFDAYKKQFHRWAFGNVRILLTHLGGILQSRMSKRQKFDFIAGNLHWFDGVFITAIAFSLLYVALGEAVGLPVATHHQRELALLGLVPLFLLVDGVARVHLALRSAGKIRFRDTLRVLGMWFAIKFTNMSAALKSLIGVQAPFVRTPKDPGRALQPGEAFTRAVSLTRGESLLAGVMWCVSGLTLWRGLHNIFVRQGQGDLLLAFWLGLYGLLFACAPIYAYLSYRTLRPGLITPLTPAPPRFDQQAAVAGSIVATQPTQAAFDVVRAAPVPISSDPGPAPVPGSTAAAHAETEPGFVLAQPGPPKP